ncbi:hypothetical protein D3C71_1603340 [compost metagenome]
MGGILKRLAPTLYLSVCRTEGVQFFKQLQEFLAVGEPPFLALRFKEFRIASASSNTRMPGRSSGGLPSSSRTERTAAR